MMFHEYELDAERTLKATDFLSKSCNWADADELHDLISMAEELVEDAMPNQGRAVWENWLSAAHLVRAQQQLDKALVEGAGIADAKAAVDLRSAKFAECGAETVRNESDGDLVGIAMRLLTSPLPNLYWHVDHSWDDIRQRAQNVPQPNDNDHGETLPEVVRLAVFVDDFPIVTPQEIKPATIYSLKMICRLATMPAQIKGLHFEFLSTLAPNQYSVSDCVFRFPEGEVAEDQDIELTCNVVFPFEQNDPFQKIVLAATAFLLLDSGRKQVRVIGHDQLKFRVRSEYRTLLSSGFRRMDAHVHDLLENLLDAQPAIRDELGELVPVLDALVAVQSTFAQGGVFKSQKVGESVFQDEVLKCLRMRLGEDVQEGPQQAGGITDIRYRGIIIELKVENTLTDRDAIATKYGRQSTQYAGVESRSVAIVLCLDQTEKTNPPGDLRNEIFLRQVDTNLQDPIRPNWAWLFMVPGNLKSPSDYSK